MSLGCGARILAIDDEQGFRDLLSLELEERGYSVDTAVNGREGLRKASRGAFDLVLCDRTMFKPNGMETLTAIKFLRPSLAVIMIFGYMTPEERQEAGRLGAHSCLAKPFEIDQLCQLIERAVKSRN